METKRKPYQAPITTMVAVELESPICAASPIAAKVGDPIEAEKRHVEIEKQADGGSMDYSDSGWD